MTTGPAELRIDVVHASVPGRLRLRVSQLRRRAERMHAAGVSLRGVDGVEHVQGNPLTGSLLLFFVP